MIKKVVTTVFALVCLALAAPALAQSPLSLPQVEVKLWPEYDDTGMLVINRVVLPGSLSMPAEFRFRIPATAGVPNAVAAIQPDGSMMNTVYRQENEGQWSTLIITATSPELQIEYYDPALKIDNRQRSYTYEWPGDQAVQEFSMQVKQPWDASGLQISPNDFGSGQQDFDTLTYFTKRIGSVPAGSPFKISLAYEKASDTPSMLQLQPTLVPPAELSSPNNPQYAVWLLAVLGLGLIVGGVIWYLRARQELAPAKSNARTHRRSTAPKNAPVPDSQGFIYCHNCGSRAGQADMFCRSCGTKLRK